MDAGEKRQDKGREQASIVDTRELMGRGGCEVEPAPPPVQESQDSRNGVE